MTKEERSLFTVRQFSQKHRAFPEGGLRYLIFNAEKNGFAKAFLRIGSKRLVDEDIFFQCVDEQNSEAAK